MLPRRGQSPVFVEWMRRGCAAQKWGIRSTASLPCKSERISYLRIVRNGRGRCPTGARPSVLASMLR